MRLELDEYFQDPFEGASDRCDLCGEGVVRFHAHVCQPVRLNLLRFAEEFWDEA